MGGVDDGELRVVRSTFLVPTRYILSKAAQHPRCVN
jgi:hypothetical protein